MTTTGRRQLNLLIAASCLIAGPAHALDPCTVDEQYAGAVDRIIDPAVGRRADLALSVIPSFQAEYGVRIVEHEVYLVRLRPSFWTASIVKDRSGAYRHDFSRARVATSVHHASLDPGLAAHIKLKYAAALTASTDPEGAGQDGIVYRFAALTLGCRQTWSPGRASLSGQLAELTELLAAHAQQSSASSQRMSEKKLRRVMAERH